MEEGGREDDEEEAYGEDEGQCDDSLEARCHPVGLSRALTGPLITLGSEACAG